MTSAEMTAADLIREQRKVATVAAETEARVKARAALLDDEIDLYVVPGRERAFCHARRQLKNAAALRFAMVVGATVLFTTSIFAVLNAKLLGPVFGLAATDFAVRASSIGAACLVASLLIVLKHVAARKIPADGYEERYRFDIARSSLGIGRRNVYWTTAAGRVRHRHWDEVSRSAVEFAAGAAEPRLTLVLHFHGEDDGQAVRFHEFPADLESEIRREVASRRR